MAHLGEAFGVADAKLAVDDGVETLEVGGFDVDKPRQPRDERVSIQTIAWGLRAHSQKPAASLAPFINLNQ